MWDATNQIIIGGTYEDYENAGCSLSLARGLRGVGVSNAVNKPRKFIAAISSLGKRIIVLDTAKEFDMLISMINTAKAHCPEHDDPAHDYYVRIQTNKFIDAINSIAMPYYTGTEIREAVENARKQSYKEGYYEHKRRIRVLFGLENDRHEID